TPRPPPSSPHFPYTTLFRSAADARPRLYQRVKLVDEDGAALRAGSVPANRNLIFHYPYASTPCFLLNLGRPAKASAHLKTADERSEEHTSELQSRFDLVCRL